MPTFITRHCQSIQRHDYTTTANPSRLQGKQLATYNPVKDHMESNKSVPLRLVVSGTAGTGKSYLINCLRLLLKENVCVCVAVPTGVAAFNIDGNMLYSLLSLPTKGEFKDLEGQHLNWLQESLASMQYLIIDEMSMVGRKLFSQVDRKKAPGFSPACLQSIGWMFLLGDFGYLPLYMTSTSSLLSDIGSNAYQTFQRAVVLDHIMRQSGVV